MSASTSASWGASAAPRRVGRFAGDRYSWSGSSVVARFAGASSVAMHVRVPVLEPHTVTIDDKAVKLDEKVVAYSAWIDDRAARVVMVSDDRERYELANDLDPAATHEIRIVREVEAFAGVHEWLGLDLGDGGHFLPPRRPALRIEFVGDSIQCGYGVLGGNATCPFTYATERASAAYPLLAARALDADASVLCWSGRGVYRNFGGSTKGTMPELYELALPEPPVVAWPFDEGDASAPGVVMIALGTNDFLSGTGKPPDIASFEKAYAAFLRRVRERRPAARIVVATSPMVGAPERAKLASALERIVAKRRGEGESKLTMVDLEYQGERVGCDRHPNEEMHRVLAKQVEAAVRAAER